MRRLLPRRLPGWGEYWFFFVSNDFFLFCLVLPDLSDDFHNNERWLKRGWSTPMSTFQMPDLTKAKLSTLSRLFFRLWLWSQPKTGVFVQGAIMRNGCGRNEHYQWHIHQSCCWSEAEPFYSESPKPAATWRRWEAQELVKGIGKGEGTGTSKECKWDKRDKEQVWHG